MKHLPSDIFFNGLFPTVNRMIRNTIEHQICIQPMVRKISRSQALWAAVFEKEVLIIITCHDDVTRCILHHANTI